VPEFLCWCGVQASS